MFDGEVTQPGNHVVRVGASAAGQRDVGLPIDHGCDVGCQIADPTAVVGVEFGEGVDAHGDPVLADEGVQVLVGIGVGHLAGVGHGEPVGDRVVDFADQIRPCMGNVCGGVLGLVGDLVQHVAYLGGVVAFLGDPSLRGIVGCAPPRAGVVQ